MASLLLAACFFVFLASLWRHPLNPGRGTAERVVLVFLMAAAWVAFLGTALSGAGWLAEHSAWDAGLLLPAVTLFKTGIPSPGAAAAVARRFFSRVPVSRSLAGFLIFFFLVACTRSLFTHPYNWDSMACHIPRVWYYLNRGSYVFLGASYWAQDIHPVNFTSAQLLAWLMLPDIRVFNSLSSLGLLVFWVQTWLFLGRFGGSTALRFTSASLLWFSVNVAVSFSSTQNDSWFAPVLFGGFLMLLRYGETGRGAYLLWGLVSLAHGLGIKQTTLFIVLAWLPLFVLFGRQFAWKLPGWKWTAATLVLGLPIALFSYIKNYRSTGHFSGYPEVIRTHGSLTDTRFMAEEGPKNFLRYAMDMLAFDGCYINTETQIMASKLNQAIKKPVNNLLTGAGIYLEKGRTRDPFLYTRPAGMDDSRSYYGILGIFLYLPVLLGGFVLIWLQPRRRELLALYLCLLLFFAANSLVSTYDQGRCRHLIHMFPVFSAFWYVLAGSPFFRLWLHGALLACALNVVCVSLFDEKRRLWGPGSIFTESRFACVKENRTSSFPIFEAMERELAPYQNIALKMPPNSVELFYFGRDHDKNPRHFYTHGSGEQTVPPGYEVLMYCNGYTAPQAGDRLIGELNRGALVYLRVLEKKPARRPESAR